MLDLSADAVEALLAWDWPGNVRELESAIVRAISVAQDGVVAAVDLGLPGLAGGPGATQSAGAPRTFKTQKRRILEVFERQYLIRLMTEHRGNVSRAARTAGKERRDLGKLLKRHGLDPRQFVGRVSAFPSSVGVAIGA
jgi:two-component system response regulator GlrR